VKNRVHPQVLALVVLLAALATDAAAYPSSHWDDGKAELNGYELTQPRYGALRKGTAVHIFVKEDFSEQAKLKANPSRPSSDRVPILKLNFIKKFPTGIYDYNLMTSVFAAFGPRFGFRPGYPVKVSYAHQEWCGSLYDELKTEKSAIFRDRHTYFDADELKNPRLAHAKNELFVDELPFIVRQFPKAYLAPGQSKKVSFLPSYERARLLHSPQRWTVGQISRSRGSTKLSVPAGQFEVETWTAEMSSKEKYSFQVEKSFPHRIIAWTGPQGEKAQLKGSTRLPYWELNHNGGEKHLAAMGLKP